MQKEKKNNGECSGENKSRKRIGDQSGSVHCCPTWSPPNSDDHADDDHEEDDADADHEEEDDDDEDVDDNEGDEQK